MRFVVVETSGYPVVNYAPKFYRPGKIQYEIMILDTAINHRVVARWVTSPRDENSKRLAYLRRGAAIMAQDLERQYA